jgi:MFS family permease
MVGQKVAFSHKLQDPSATTASAASVVSGQHPKLMLDVSFHEVKGFGVLPIVCLGLSLLAAIALAAQRIHANMPEAKPLDAGGLAWAMVYMPQVLVFACWMQWYQYFSGDPFDAFVESMTNCPRPVPVDGYHCPAGSVLRKGLCEPEPSNSPDWSLSVHCADKAMVLSHTAQLNGINASIASAVGMITVFVAGSYMDALGRKSVLTMFLIASILVKVLLALSCLTTWSTFVAIIVIQNVIEVMSASPVYPALNCMVSDLSSGDPSLRGGCYAALEAVKNIASLVALLSGYPVLKAHLTNYTWFWSVLGLVSIAAYLVFSAWISETLPQPSKGTDSQGASAAAEIPTQANIWSSCLDGFLFSWKDSFLRQYLIIWAIVGLAVNGAWSLSAMFLQSYLGVEQANASLCRACWFMSLMCGSALSAALIRRFGAQTTHGVALAVMSASWFLCGLGGVWRSAAEQLFWVFGVCTFGMAFGVLTPCFGTIISERVPTSLQGKVFSSSVIVGTAFGIPLGPLWSQVFFSPASVGWKAGLSWLVSAGILLLTGIWYCLLCLTHKGSDRGSTV